jgi:hypothetical protein
MSQLLSNNGFAVYADASRFRPPVDVHSALRSKNAVLSSASADVSRLELGADLGTSAFNTLDFASWLPACAKEYHISKSVDDYILVPVIAMPSDLPNRNGVGFPLSELRTWRTDDGMLAFQTFKGKPVHIEHDNKDPTKAVGVIIDTAMMPMLGFGGGSLWKLLLLLAIDRSKDPVYAMRVANGDINSYSMGAWVEAYSCGYCGAPAGACSHINLRRPRDFYILDGKLVYRRVHGIKGFECSIVEDPAFVTAISDKLMFM